MGLKALIEFITFTEETKHFFSAGWVIKIYLKFTNGIEPFVKFTKRAKQLERTTMRLLERRRCVPNETLSYHGPMGMTQQPMAMHKQLAKQ